MTKLPRRQNQWPQAAHDVMQVTNERYEGASGSFGETLDKKNRRAAPLIIWLTQTYFSKTPPAGTGSTTLNK